MTGSFGLNFLTGFTKYTVLPSFVAVLATLPVLLLIFWKDIPSTITPVDVNPRDALLAPWSAAFFSTLLIVTIAVLVGTSFAPGGVVHVWMVTAPAGVLGLAYNLLSDVVLPPTPPEPTLSPKPHDTTDINGHSNHQFSEEKADVVSPENQKGLGDAGFTVESCLKTICRRFPRTAFMIKKLPIPVLPFAMCQFILVRALLELGWIRVFASGFIRACQTPVQSAFFTTVVTACFLCPFAGTNIGATILMVEILYVFLIHVHFLFLHCSEVLHRRDARFAGSQVVQQDSNILSAAVLGVALGSNLGAFSYTFAASLAGLLWRMLLENKGITIRQRTFAILNFAPLCIQVVLVAAVIVLEVYYSI